MRPEPMQLRQSSPEWSSLPSPSPLGSPSELDPPLGELTELFWHSSSPGITVARVFVDRPSSSLGMAAIARPTGPSLAAIEHRAEEEVRSTCTLEPFRVFWDPPGSSDDLG